MNTTSITGKVWKYGDNVNTDVLFPGKYTYTLTDKKEIAKHALEDLDPTFAANVKAGDIIVGGRNWGCGSSREQAASCLLYNGVGAVIAASFNRIFYRNAVNFGLLALTCPAAVAAIQPGETITIDLERSTIRCAAGEFDFPPICASVRGMIETGGLIEYVKRKLTSVAGVA